jgi:potassium efflux system protein
VRPIVNMSWAKLRKRLRFALAIALTLAAALPQAHAAATNGSAGIEAARKSVAAAPLNDVQREAATGQLDAAEADADAADGFMKQIAALRSEAATQPARVTQLRRSMEQDRDQVLAAWKARLPRNADAETLERLLEQENSIITGLTAQIEGVGKELALLLSGPAETATEIATLRQHSEELSIPLPATEGEPAALAEARRLRRASELKRTQAELELRLIEQDTATRRQQLYELTIDELRFRQSLHTARVEVLQAEIADIGRRQVVAMLARITARARDLAGSTGVLAQALDHNGMLGRELVEQNERLVTDRAALATNQEARDRTGVSLRDSRARLELGSSNDQVGRWLWGERRRLESPDELKQRLDDIRGALADARLRLVGLNEESRALADIPGAARTLAASATELVDEGQPADSIDPRALEPVLHDRAEILELLQPVYQRRTDALEQSEQAVQTQYDDTQTLRQLLDRHLLWISSHRPVDVSWFGRIPAGVADLVKPARWATTWELVRLELDANPLPWAAAILLVLALVELRRRAPERIQAEAPVTRQIRRDNYLATARALAWTLIGAAPLPVALLFLGLLLEQAGEPGRFSDSMGQSLRAIAAPVYSVQIMLWTVLDRGLGQSHFRWVRARRDTIRKLLPVTSLIVLPMCFTASLAFNRNLEVSNDVEARIAIVIAGLVLTWSLWRSLKPGRVWATRGVDVEPSRARVVARVALALGSLAIVGLALFGYVYSAGLVLRAVLASFTLTVALSLAFGLLGRWFLLGERRLAWHRQEERRATQAAAAEAGDGATDTEPELTLEQINAQTGRLLRALRLTVTATGFVWVWAELLPAFARLDEIALWHFTEAAPDGTEVQLPVTMMALVLGAVTLVLTVVGARNLPGLIEIGLLSKTHIDAPSRYAITSLLRYAIVIAGTVIGLGLFGLRWSQLQWMAAALTVGLGFGLQEIFANFVSGIILLFERPFRVGDTITITDLSGRVTRIRTRATTILDFENKEIVIPNKSFITGQLINWTLSDTTTRVTVKFGVDYGTDPHKVIDLMRQAARETPVVLEDPEPQVQFIAFGANSLDFELRVFVAALGDRPIAQNALNIRITELFAENGITMAFPQLDVHIRDLPPGFLPGEPPAPPKE